MGMSECLSLLTQERAGRRVRSEVGGASCQCARESRTIDSVVSGAIGSVRITCKWKQFT